MPTRRLLVSLTFLVALASLRADPPVASYIFPAGGQRGTTVAVRVGGLNLHSRCGFELLGPGVAADRELKRTATVWHEGPMLPLPDSQQAEDYPKDMACTVRIAADAAPGVRAGRLWTAQGASSGLAFVVGELPEVVEQDLVRPARRTTVTLPVTANGRIFPREDVDDWEFAAKKGQTITATALAGRLGFPLEPRLELLDVSGRRLAENAPHPGAADARLTATIPADGEYRVRIHDARFGGGQNHVYRLTITTDPPRAEPDTPVPAQSLDVPVSVRGRIDPPGEVDAWPVFLKKGSQLLMELHARRIDSPLLGVLTVRDAAGKEVARLDGAAQNADPVLPFTPPADGIYRVEVADRFRSRGGPAFVYQLRIAPAPKPAPDFRLALAADMLAVPRGGQAKLKVTAERLGGFTGPIELSVDGLPDGVTAGRATLAANQTTAEIPLAARADAPIRAVPLTVRGTAKVGEGHQTRTARFAGKHLPEIDTVLLAVAVPTPFMVKADYLLSQAPRGTVFPRRYRIERNGFTGPLTVTLADRQARHLQGVTGPTLVVPADRNEFDYPIQMPPWMETGRTCRACIMAIGEVQDRDGRRHEVSFSSVEQNMQIIVVVEPGRLGLELGQSSVRAAQGGRVELPFRVQRGEGLKGPATVELLSATGVSAAPANVPADRSDGVLTLRFTAGAGGPAVVRATVTADGRPVVAEAKVDVVGQ